jgi:DUF1365 family protein
MSERRSCLYFGTVFHQRLRPKRHRLAYGVFSLYLDLDELEGLASSLRLFSRDLFNLFSFYSSDHGGSTAEPLRRWVEETLAQAGIDLPGGAIRLLCYPRVFGYVFNPLSVFYCFDRDDALKALIYEVNNTFGQRHTYLIPVEHAEAGAIRQACDKHFYVSPFMPVAGRYQFRVEPPGETLGLVINYGDDAGPLLHASFRGRRMPLDDRGLLRAAIRYPLMTFKVIAGIHWEAAKLWRKRVPLIDRPPPPAYPVTVVRANEP